jgi:hypothetical protein
MQIRSSDQTFVSTHRGFTCLMTKIILVECGWLYYLHDDTFFWIVNY